MIEFHDPRGDSAIAADPYMPRFDLRGRNTAKVALLANGFPDSVNFLQHIGDVLSEQFPALETFHYNKGNASKTVSEEMLGEIGNAEVAITAYGH